MCRLDPFCSEIFGGINENAVDLVPNYDNTTTEPVHLPTSFPNILVTPNVGIAVGMASNICSFNLAETCDAAMQMLLNPDTTTEQLLDILRAPDFPCGGILLYDRGEMGEIYRTGRGSFRVRAKYVYDPKANCIDIIEIPYSTSIEQILKRISDLVKDNKLREITDIRDEIDVEGFKLTLDLRRGVDPDKLMLKLYKMTTLEDSFDCNFNVLIDGVPQVLGVRGLLEEWIRFRVGCVKRQLSHQLDKKNGRLHLLIGLGKILLDIDKAIKIIRETKLDREVVPNLMSGFSIDEAQAEFVADIRLRNINREYIHEPDEEYRGAEKGNRRAFRYHRRRKEAEKANNKRAQGSQGEIRQAAADADSVCRRRRSIRREPTKSRMTPSRISSSPRRAISSASAPLRCA
jgi:DNA gyrase subunit A